MCGGGGAPEDKSDKVAKIEADAAREQREAEARAAEEARIRQEQEEARKLAEFETRLGSAFTTGVGSAEDYFRQRGVDPAQYSSNIMSEANMRRASVPQLAGEVGSYFSGIGEDVYTELTDALRGRTQRSLNEIAPEGFARGRIQDTADDEIINAILGEQRLEAENYARRLLDRGVITEGGLGAALEDIGKQANVGEFKLQELGSGILEGGRGGAIDIANRGRSRASTLDLGDTFDPYANTGTELNNFFTDFLSNLGNRFRAQAPSDLFDVSGLPVLAGAAQGAGNTAFDPKAIAGLFDEEEDEDENAQSGGVF